MLLPSIKRFDLLISWSFFSRHSLDNAAAAAAATANDDILKKIIVLCKGSSVNDVTFLVGGGQGFCDNSIKAEVARKVMMGYQKIYKIVWRN